jgi:lysophospholipase L1-like esterase
MNDSRYLDASNAEPGAPIASFVAIGDSFTEGMNDPAPGNGGFRGWADRLAEALAERDPGFRYANLAVRGKLLRQIVADQVPAAVSLLDRAPAPALVSIAGGGNDLLRPGGDPDTLAELFDAAVARLRQTGSGVLLFTGFDPRAFRLMGLLRGKIAAYNMHLRAIADARGCALVDLWGMRFLTRPEAWSPDRLHLTSESHRKIADRAAEILGIQPPGAGPVAAPPPIVWSRPAAAVPRDRAAWVAARREDYRWAREHFGPWVGRRLRGTSSGDGRHPKRPELLPVRPADLRQPYVSAAPPQQEEARSAGCPERQASRPRAATSWRCRIAEGRSRAAAREGRSR